MPRDKQSFWTTSAGFLTALAALITALTGLYAALARSSSLSSTPAPSATSTAFVGTFNPAPPTAANLTSAIASSTEIGGKLRKNVQNQIVKAEGRPVYIIEQGKKRLIHDSDTLMSLGYRFEDIKSVSVEELRSYPTGDPIPSVKGYLDIGNLLQGSGPTVYVIKDGMKHRVPDYQTFAASGFKDEDIGIVPDEWLNKLPEGAPLESVE